MIALAGKLEEGYFQGMNSFVGVVMLSGCDEYETYALCNFIFLEIGYYEIFKNGFFQLFEISKTVEKMLRNHKPILWRKMSNCGVQLNMIALKWLVTLFSEYVSVNEVNFF